VTADLRLTDGSILLDQLALTGESLPVEAVAKATAYAGSIVRFPPRVPVGYRWQNTGSHVIVPNHVRQLL